MFFRYFTLHHKSDDNFPSYFVVFEMDLTDVSRSRVPTERGMEVKRGEMRYIKQTYKNLEFRLDDDDDKLEMDKV